MNQIRNEFLSAAISPVGGELRSLRDRKTGFEYLWQGDEAYWNQSAPNLFPFIGRLLNARYTCGGETYSMPIHGFLPAAPMQGEGEGDSAVFSMEDTEATRAVWPFRFRLEICYRLSGRKLSVEYRVENRGDKELPFSVGGHPGFNLPISEGKAFSDYALEFDAPENPRRILFSEKNILADGDAPYPMEDARIPLSHGLFDEDAIILSGAGHAVTLTDGAHGVRAEYPDFDFIGFWHAPKTEAPYLCIEPWSALPGREGVTEDVSTMPHLTRLDPGDTACFRWSVEIF